ncbi:MAG TPA: hypothetical protein VG223_08390 [Solirubrobacteraceae bacterium]|nr:hypothetical protein [Solirubrobacteraceae bacterium]
MGRFIGCVVACLLLLPSGALAGGGELTGKITYVGSTVLTIQTGGRQVGVINALTRGARALAARAYPYVWGGGHGEAGVASIGVKGGPGYNGKRIGYDCSGAIAAVLAAAGLWPAGGPVPNDAGVIAQLRAEHLIARGPGTAPNEVTLYDHPGVHIFMNIDGRFFGTSDGGAGDPQGSPTWLDDGAPDVWSRAFKQYHFLPAVLAQRTTYGQSYTFQTTATPLLSAGAELGDRVTVGYASGRAGEMVAQTIVYAGAVTATGTVTAIAPDGSSLAITTSTGQPLTLSTSSVPALLQGVEVGDGVQVTYTPEAGGALVPHAVTIISEPVAATPPGGGISGPAQRAVTTRARRSA